ncbi:MAG TPA: L,D-transpeptidase family protein [Myxococcaceae bacterium]|jgi:lipoprotein-anchoring transpeptidase ErfK/SrfK
MSSSILRCLAVLWALGGSLAASAADTPAADAFEAYLRPPTPATDGFEPVPSAYRLPAGSDMRALARGRVVSVDAKTRLLTLEHFYYENHQLLSIRSEYSGLAEVNLRPGDEVQRGQRLGRVGNKGPASVTLRAAQRFSAEQARGFTQARARLPLPASEPVLVLVSHADFAMRLYEKGREVTRVEVGFGQAAGRKKVRGDNKTPMGLYYVVQKHRGTFTGAGSEYFGGHWMRINYPNAYDADRGVSEGLITREVRDQIASAWAERKTTNASTRLGSGIGFHGWVGPWTLEESGGRLSWGCIVMHTPDITTLYDRIPEGAMVVLF